MASNHPAVNIETTQTEL